MSAALVVEPKLPRRFGAHCFRGSLDEWLQWASWQFEAIVGPGGLRLWGKPVTASTRRLADGRREAFWHLATGHGAERRRLDLARVAAIGRVWALLELADACDEAATWWREKDGALHVAAADFSLVVVLAESQESYRLLTSYPVTRPKQQAQLRRRATAAGDQQAAGPAGCHHLWRHDARFGNRWTPPAAGARRRIREVDRAECLQARHYLRSQRRAPGSVRHAC